MDAVRVEDDGLFCETIKSHSLVKYHLLQYHIKLFVKGMRAKFSNIVYIDLNASCGYSRAEDTGFIYAGSPFIALTAEHPFDRHIFCEVDSSKISVLRERVERSFPAANVTYLNVDCNEGVEQIIRALPEYGRNNTMLCLCFADPYAISQLQFGTIKRLADRMIDFVMNIPTSEFTRWSENFCQEDAHSMDHFLGDTEWRQEWEIASRDGCSPRKFLVDAYTKRMQNLNFLEDTESDVVRNVKRKSPLYDLKIFSRHPRGTEFAKKSHRGSKDQLSLQLD